MDQVTQQTAASAEETAAASEELSAQAQSLMEQVKVLAAMVDSHNGISHTACEKPTGDNSSIYHDPHTVDNIQSEHKGNSIINLKGNGDGAEDNLNNENKEVMIPMGKDTIPEHDEEFKDF